MLSRNERWMHRGKFQELLNRHGATPLGAFVFDPVKKTPNQICGNFFRRPVGVPEESGYPLSIKRGGIFRFTRGDQMLLEVMQQKFHRRFLGKKCSPETADFFDRTFLFDEICESGKRAESRSGADL